ncbi:hypothetical protein L211DRAFT_836024 [Terfezia boudieri ATCC MYA-4762]|uniref:pH-response regulator protein palC n=1 Tax=Terfezia boudieri ATCC MYA-4762 TaxID=1051890 RepID=A0A3N4LXN9_9PEZI|nr:hypothetical protein L211DRAFT_836024 [Terfezia boudieri ATCC MYA-4762]
MPFPFTLPTTSTVSFSQHYTSPTYPSLPLSCTTHRGILRDSLKAHKRLSLSAQGANIKHIINITTEYISYLQFLQEALKSGDASPIPTTLEIETEWRPTLSSSTRFGITQSERRKGKGLEYEVFWAYSTLAYAHTIQARALLMEFLSPTTSSPDSAASPLLPQATNHVLTSAQIFQYLLTLTPPIATAGDQKNSIPVNICEPMLSSLASISLGSATLLAVLRTDPYPAYLAITGIPGSKKNNDIYSKDYLYSPPPPPTGVKAMLYSRLCIAASEHAVRAQGVISDLIRAGAINEEYVRYLEDLKRVAKARGCRFLGVDAEVQGRLGEGLGWIKLGKEFLGGTIPTTSSNDDKEKKTLASRMEKLRLSKLSPPSLSSHSSSTQTSDSVLPPNLDPCSVHSELQTIEGLDAKWSKTNDKLVFEKVPATNSLVSKIPGGREIHVIKAYSPVKLGSESINTLRRGGMEKTGEYSQHQDWPNGDYSDSSDEEDGGKGSSYQVPGGYY